MGERNTRDQVLAAARRAFTEKGFGGASFRTIGTASPRSQVRS